jgi:pilus assembly protein Flp/PilA
MMKKLINFFKDDEGATMPEYALMVALIAIVCITAVSTLGTNSESVFDTAATEMSGAVTP